MHFYLFFVGLWGVTDKDPAMVSDQRPKIYKSSPNCTKALRSQNDFMLL